MAHVHEDALVLNRLNGGRLSVRDGSLVDGKHIIVTRYSAYDETYPQRWNTVKVGEDAYGRDIIHIEQSDENGTFRVDVGSDDPKADATPVLLKKADESDRQKWHVWNDVAGEGRLVKLCSHVDTSVVMCVYDYGGYWDLVVRNREISSVDRLWYFNERAHKDIIPN
ncbi:hypothetical protein GCM10027563_16240 [Parasphingorhabdus pacifica]